MFHCRFDEWVWIPRTLSPGCTWDLVFSTQDVDRDAQYVDVFLRGDRQ